MSPRDAFTRCLEHEPPALFEAALWIAAEHDPQLQPAHALGTMHDLHLRVGAALPSLPPRELAQPMLRGLSQLDYNRDDEGPTRPHHALMHEVLRRRRGQPLMLALIALELARRLDIPLQGVNFPGQFLLRVPDADHLLDPCGGRRLYPRDCRELLGRHFGPHVELGTQHLQVASARSMLQRLSRNLRELHLQQGDELAALKDAERVLLIGPPNPADHLARADIYQRLACPQGERFDLEHALLLCDDAATCLQLSQRLHRLEATPALH